MKKVFITVAFLAGFLFITTSFSPKANLSTHVADSYHGSFSMTGRVLKGLCLGEDITLEGDLHYVINYDYKRNGGYREMNHFNTRSLKGIGTSGKLYQFQEVDTEVYKTIRSNSCNLYFDRVFIMKIITRGANSNYFMKLRMEGYFNECEQLTTIESSEITEECR